MPENSSEMTLCIFIRIVQLWLHLDLSFVWKICCSKMFLNIRKYFYIIMRKVANGFLDTLRILRNVNHILVWTNSFQDFNNISNFIHSRRKHVYHPLIHFLSYLQLKACIICSTFILWSKTGSHTFSPTRYITNIIVYYDKIVVCQYLKPFQDRKQLI